MTPGTCQEKADFFRFVLSVPGLVFGVYSWLRVEGLGVRIELAKSRVEPVGRSYIATLRGCVCGCARV